MLIFVLDCILSNNYNYSHTGITVFCGIDVLTVKNPIEPEHVTRKCNPSLLKKAAYLYLGVK